MLWSGKCASRICHSTTYIVCAAKPREYPANKSEDAENQARSDQNSPSIVIANDCSEMIQQLSWFHHENYTKQIPVTCQVGDTRAKLLAGWFGVFSNRLLEGRV